MKLFIQVLQNEQVSAIYSEEVAVNLPEEFLSELVEVEVEQFPVAEELKGHDSKLFYVNGVFEYRNIPRELTDKERIDELTILVADLIGGAI